MRKMAGINNKKRIYSVQGAFGDKVKKSGAIDL